MNTRLSVPRPRDLRYRGCPRCLARPRHSPLARTVVPAAVTLLCLALGLSAATVTAAAQESVPGADVTAERCRDPQFRQFDFWVGRWEVRSPDGEILGHNRIRPVGGGCGLLEEWIGSGGGTGMSINTWDVDLGRWTQRWVGQGATLWLEGGLVEGPDGPRMVLSGPRPRATPGSEMLDRISWTPLPGGDLLQVWETSADGGASWEEIFRGRYVRMDGAGGS